MSAALEQCLLVSLISLFCESFIFSVNSNWLAVATPFNERKIDIKMSNKGYQEPLAGSNNDANSHCANSLYVPEAFCLEHSSKVFMPPSSSEHLAGMWTFDNMLSADISGNKNHMIGKYFSGPGFNGHGSSGAFFNGAFAFVKGNEALASHEYTVSFWIYLLDTNPGNTRNIFTRGDFERPSPAIMLHSSSNRLIVKISTSNNSAEELHSHGAILDRRWTLVSVACDKQYLKVYMNGILDSSLKLRGEPIIKSGNITIGSNNIGFIPGFEGYFDDLRFYSEALSEQRLAMLALPSLTGFNNDQGVVLGSPIQPPPWTDLQLANCAGCRSCSLMEFRKVNLCPAGFRSCTLEDLHTGSLKVLRANGWVQGLPTIWYHESEGPTASDDLRNGFCCQSQ